MRFVWARGPRVRDLVWNMSKRYTFEFFGTCQSVGAKGHRCSSKASAWKAFSIARVVVRRVLNR